MMTKIMYHMQILLPFNGEEEDVLVAWMTVRWNDDLVIPSFPMYYLVRGRVHEAVAAIERVERDMKVGMVANQGVENEKRVPETQWTDWAGVKACVEKAAKGIPRWLHGAQAPLSRQGHLQHPGSLTTVHGMSTRLGAGGAPSNLEDQDLPDANVKAPQPYSFFPLAAGTEALERHEKDGPIVYPQVVPPPLAPFGSSHLNGIADIDMEPVGP